MKVEYINPFLESVNELFTTMLDSKVEKGEVGVTVPEEKGTSQRFITALIGLSGSARGTVALSFPVPTALKMVSRLLGQKTQIADDTVSDAVAELVNIIAGGAKANFQNGSDRPIDLSLPTVVRGTSYYVEYPSNATWLDVPFTSDLGPFRLRVTFETDGSS